MYQIIPSVDLGKREDSDINLLILYSPFDLSKRDEARLVYQEGATLSHYLEGVPDDDSFSIYLDGQIYSREACSLVVPKKGDYLVLIQNVFGGGDSESKGIIRTIAMIAVTAISAWATAGISSPLMKGLAAGAISAAGGMLVNALIPMPTATSQSEEEGESPTYGFGMPNMSAREGGPVQIIYGEHWTGGLLVGRDSSLSEDGKDEVLSMLIAVSEGEIAGIEEVLVNEQPIESFEAARWSYKTGSLKEPYSSEFGGAIRRAVEVGRKVTMEDAVIELPAGTNLAELQLSFPYGLIKRKEGSNDKFDQSVEIVTEYRVKGGAWQAVGSSQTPLAFGTEITHPKNKQTDFVFKLLAEPSYDATIFIDRRYSDVEYWDQGILKTKLKGNNSSPKNLVSKLSAFENGNRCYYRYRVVGRGVSVSQATAFQHYSQSNVIKDCTHEPKRMIIQVPMTNSMHDDVYEVRFRRTNEESDSEYIMDEVWVNQIEAVQYSPVGHRGTAILNVTLKATDQLNGTPSILCRVKGRRVKTYDRYGNQTGYIWTQNNAWIALDIALEQAGIPKEQIDFDRFVEWANFCMSNNLQFNGIFDSSSNVWDALQTVTRCGLAKINPVGSQLSLIIHTPRSPVMMFGSSNIIADSLSLSWSSNKDRANVFEVEYYDREHRNAAAFVKIVDHEELATGAPIRETKLSLPGVDNARQAEILLGIYRASNRYMGLTCTFDAYLDSLACVVGDVVMVQSDHVDWGRQCRSLEPQPVGSRIHVNLSPSDIMEYAAQVMIHYPVLRSGSASIVSVNAVERTVTLDMPVAKDSVSAIKVGAVSERIVGYDNMIVRLDRVPKNFVVGARVEMLKYDYLYVSDVLETDPQNGFLILGHDIPQEIPAQGIISIGKRNAVAKPFIVTKISGEGDFKRTLSCIEYNESLFNLDGNYEHTAPMNPYEPPAPVKNLGVVEEIYKDGLTVFTRAYITWEKPSSGSYATARLSISKNGQAPETITIPSGTMRHYVDSLKTGDQLEVSAFTIDASGQVCPVAEIVKHKIAGASAPPSNVRNFMAGRAFAGISLKWSANEEIDVAGYEIRKGANWSTADVLFERLDGTSVVIDNKESGDFTFLIKAMDVEGNRSPEPTITSIEIPGPEPVTGLTAVQNDRTVILRWDKHASPDVTLYAVHRGQSWAMSEHIADVSGNSYSVDSDSIEAEDYFWVKPIDRFGIPSKTAVYARVARNDLEDYNVIKSIDFGADGWSGAKVNMEKDPSGSLKGLSGESYFEYRETRDTDSEKAARLILRDFPFSTSSESDNRNWASLEDVTWAEADTIFWVPFGVDESHRFERFISYRLKGGIDPSLVEGYDCHSHSSMATGSNGSKLALSNASLTDALMVRGAMQAVGLHTTADGYAQFPFANSKDSDRQCVFSLAIARAGDVCIAEVVGSTRSIKILVKDIGREYHLVVNDGATLILPKMMGSSSPRNAVINFMVRQKYQSVVVSASVHGAREAESAELPISIGAITSLKISKALSPAAGQPAVFIRTVRLERGVEVNGRTQLAVFHAKTPRLCGWSRYEKFAAGFYESGSVEIVYRIAADSTSMIPGISSSRLIVDMPDVIDRGFVEITEPDNIQVKFSRKFTVPPRVVPQFTGSVGSEVTPGATVYAHDITTEGFYLAIYDSMGGLTTGTVNWNASGY